MNKFSMWVCEGYIMDIYIDVIILENIIINFLILYVTSRFVKIFVPTYRLLIGAVIGTVYVVFLLLIPSIDFYYSAIAKFLLSLVIVEATFFSKKIREFIKLLVCFYISTFMFAGGAFAIIYVSGRGGFVRNGVYYMFGQSNGLIMLLAVFFIGIAVKAFYEIIQSRSLKGKMFVPVNIKLNDKSLNLKGLVDTGNSLHDPISNLPVVVAELDCLKEILPVSISDALSKPIGNNFDNIAEVFSECEWDLRVRLVPFNSLGKENGMLIGFKPDRVFVGEDHKEMLAIVCIYSRRLSHNNSYTALLSPDLVI